MAIRTRKTWKPQSDGQYVRQLGWKHGRNGKLVQAKFRLGIDLREAKRREMMLSEVWERVEQDARAEPVTWPEEALDIAKQIVRDGRATVPKRDGESNGLYLRRVSRLAERLPNIPLMPADEAAFRQAAEEGSRSAAEFVALHGKASEAFRDRMHQAMDKLPGSSGSPLVAGGPTLHEALRDHIAWLKEEYGDSNGDVSAWGKVKIRQVELLLDRHDDLPLAGLDHDAIERMVRFWRQRPVRKGSDRPIAKKSAEHQIAALKSFLRWLSRSSKYEWKKPESFDDIRVRIGTRAEDVRPQVTPEDIFTLDELILLNRYATPLERCLLLLV